MSAHVVYVRRRSGICRLVGAVAVAVTVTSRQPGRQPGSYGEKAGAEVDGELTEGIMLILITTAMSSAVHDRNSAIEGSAPLEGGMR
jgi:hypothetical protein